MKSDDLLWVFKFNLLQNDFNDVLAKALTSGRG